MSVESTVRTQRRDHKKRSISPLLFNKRKLKSVFLTKYSWLKYLNKMYPKNYVSSFTSTEVKTFSLSAFSGRTFQVKLVRQLIWLILLGVKDHQN